MKITFQAITPASPRHVDPDDAGMQKPERSVRCIQWGERMMGEARAYLLSSGSTSTPPSRGHR